MLAILAFVACNNQPAAPAAVPGALPAGGTVLATVNNEPVTQELVEALRAQMPPQVLAQIAASGQDPFVDQLIDIDLLYREALKRDLHNDIETQSTVALATRKALADKALQAVVDERTTDEALEKWYQDHLVQFAKPQVLLNHILVKTEAEADQAIASIEGGEAYTAVAMKVSMDKASAVKGGELGWLGERDLGEPLGPAAFAAEVGKPTKVQSQFGFHIILVSEKRDQAPFADVKEQVEGKVKQEAAMAYLDEIRGLAAIEKKTPPAPAGGMIVPQGGPGQAPPQGAGKPPPAPPAPPDGHDHAKSDAPAAPEAPAKPAEGAQ